jgi:hypothetical protein
VPPRSCQSEAENAVVDLERLSESQARTEQKVDGSMTEAAIRHQLVKRGRTLFDALRERVQFTKIDEADRPLNDLGRYPHVPLSSPA